MAGFRWRPRHLLRWLPARSPAKAERPRLPWWGSLLSSDDQATLRALIESGKRLRAMMGHPGWQDVETVIQGWLDHYTEHAQRLGQVMREEQGRMVLSEVDTPEDDRRRLIAAAQASALKGLLVDLRARAKPEELIRRRARRQVPTEEDGALI